MLGSKQGKDGFTFYSVEPSRKRGRKFRILLLLFFIITCVSGYFFGPRLYYTYISNAIPRVSARRDAFEKRYSTGKEDPEVLLEYVGDSRRLIQLLQKDNPALDELYFYDGLFMFYELILRIPVDALNLIQLVGRGYLPLERKIAGTSNGIALLSLNAVIAMRKSLAINPDLDEASTARLVMAYSDLFYTGRTDPYIRDQLILVDREKISPALQQKLDWVQLVFFSMIETRTEREALIADIQSQKKNNSSHLQISETEIDLLNCYSAFYSRQFMEALKLARRIKENQNVPQLVQIEAIRMEGEIFLIQSGPDAAEFYFRQALKLSNETDAFVKERLLSLSKK